MYTIVEQKRALYVLYRPNLDGQIFNLIFRSTSAIVWPYNICVYITVCECCCCCCCCWCMCWCALVFRDGDKRSGESSTWTFNARSMCVHKNILIFVVLFPFSLSLSLSSLHSFFSTHFQFFDVLNGFFFQIQIVLFHFVPHIIVLFMMLFFFTFMRQSTD